jgi:hypothetical protein
MSGLNGTDNSHISPFLVNNGHDDSSPYCGEKTMKFSKYFILFLLLSVFCTLPNSLRAVTGAERWTAGPWQSQGMISWGNEDLVVDFGINGLWNYNGSWIQLSRWNPKSIVAWGNGNLTVDFGSHGLWNYGGESWLRIAQGSL